MKATAQQKLKRLLVESLAVELQESTPQREMSALHHHLQSFIATHGRFFPQQIFNYSEDVLTSFRGEDKYTQIFYEFLLTQTRHIEKVFNKSRKLERAVKALLQLYGDLLPHQLGDKSVFFTFLHVFLFDSKGLPLPGVLASSTEMQLTQDQTVTNELRAYLVLYRLPLLRFFSALLLVHELESDDVLVGCIDRAMHLDNLGDLFCDTLVLGG